jgi:hypothetical protein
VRAGGVDLQQRGVGPDTLVGVCVERSLDVLVAEQRLAKPTWTDHVYSCTFVYPKGSFVLSTKELVSDKTTTDYFNGLKQKLGFKANLYGLGQGAFVAKNVTFSRFGKTYESGLFRVAVQRAGRKLGHAR